MYSFYRAFDCTPCKGRRTAQRKPTFERSENIGVGETIVFPYYITTGVNMVSTKITFLTNYKIKWEKMAKNCKKRHMEFSTNLYRLNIIIIKKNHLFTERRRMITAKFNFHMALTEMKLIF